MHYISINTKIRAMKGNLLKYEDYQNLIRINSVEQIGHKLREYKQYENIIGSIPENIMYNRGILEKKLSDSVNFDFNKIYNFVSHSNTKKYLNIFNLHYKIKLLKLIICAINDERNESIKGNTNILNGKSSLDIDKLSNSKNINELIENLKDTEFYTVLDSVKDRTSLFDINMKLDLYYYMKLWNFQNKYLDKHDKKILHKINGTEIDTQNIIWICRLKTYYDIKPNFIYSYLIPYQYKLSSTEIKRIVESSTLEDMYQEISTTKYGSYFAGKKNLIKIQRDIMNSIYKNVMSLHKNGVATITNYIYLKDLEVSNLISLLESTRYKLSQNDTMQYITIGVT